MRHGRALRTCEGSRGDVLGNVPLGVHRVPVEPVSNMIVDTSGSNFLSWFVEKPRSVPSPVDQPWLGMDAGKHGPSFNVPTTIALALSFHSPISSSCSLTAS